MHPDRSWHIPTRFRHTRPNPSQIPAHPDRILTKSWPESRYRHTSTKGQIPTFPDILATSGCTLSGDLLITSFDDYGTYLTISLRKLYLYNQHYRYINIFRMTYIVYFYSSWKFKVSAISSRIGVYSPNSPKSWSPKPFLWNSLYSIWIIIFWSHWSLKNLVAFSNSKFQICFQFHAYKNLL